MHGLVAACSGLHTHGSGCCCTPQAAVKGLMAVLIRLLFPNLACCGHTLVATVMQGMRWRHVQRCTRVPYSKN